MYLVSHLIFVAVSSLALFFSPVLAEELVVTNSPSIQGGGGGVEPPCTKTHAFKKAVDFSGATLKLKATCPRGEWDVGYQLYANGQELTIEMLATERGSSRTCRGIAFSPVGGVEQFQKLTTTCDSGRGQPKITLEAKREG